MINKIILPVSVMICHIIMWPFKLFERPVVEKVKTKKELEQEFIKAVYDKSNYVEILAQLIPEGKSYANPPNVTVEEKRGTIMLDQYNYEQYREDNGPSRYSIYYKDREFKSTKDFWRFKVPNLFK